MAEPDVARNEAERLRARIAELERTHQLTAFLEAIFCALPALVFRFEPDLTISFVSRLLPGLREEDIVGAPALDFIPAEDHERARRVIQRALGTGVPGGYETTGPGPNSERRSYRVFVAPVAEPDGRNGGIFVAVDTTELHAQERELAEVGQKLRIALDATRLGLWSWDLVTGELIWDERMKQAIGRCEALTLPDYVESVVHPDDRDKVRRVGERSMAAGRLEPTTHRIVRPDGEVRWMLTVGEIQTDASGRPTRLMGGNLDITEQRVLEDQLRRAQKMEAIGQLTAGVAHNFNNMLMAVLPRLELLRQVVPDSHAELLDDAVSAAERSADMVRKLMTYAGQRRPVDPRPCDAAALARRIVSMCEGTFDRHIAIECEVTATMPHVRADAADLEQVLMNLLVNARDAVLEQRRDAARIDVSVSNQRGDPGQADGFVVLSVRDNGVGMTESAKQHVFEPFFTSKEVGRGTGLGLATSYAIVRDLGGRIEVESALGVGTTVSVILPASAAPETEARDEPPSEARVSDGSVLVVDDEPMIRRLVEQVLSEQGWTVRTAGDGATALAELAREPVQVILLDRSMPGTPGPALLGRLRELAPVAKVAYFTGQEVAPEELGTVDAVIQKPIRMVELAEIVRDLARRS